MKTNVSTKINQCIACPIAHQVISDYLTFYNDYLEYQKSNKPYDEDFKVVVQGIAETLNFEGSFEEQFDFVLNLSKAKLSKKGLNEENFECVETIHKIIKSIKSLFYSGVGDYEFFVEDCQKHTVEVISKIQTLLKRIRNNVGTLKEHTYKFKRRNLHQRNNRNPTGIYQYNQCAYKFQ